MLEAKNQQTLERASMALLPSGGLLSADGRFLYAWSAERFEDLQTAFERDLNPMPGTLALPGDSAAWSLSRRRQELYELDAQLGTLSILDLTGQEPPTLVAVGKEPVALVVSSDEEMAYVANRGSHSISVVHLPGATVWHTIPLPGEPLSLALRQGSDSEQ